MIRMILEGIGWVVVVLILAKLLGCIELTIHITTPAMTTPQPTPAIDLQAFKREAWRLSRTQPYTHSQALEALAKQRGFKTYAALRAALKEPQA